MFINLTNPLLKNVAVRQAMAYAIDRHKASTIGEYGYEPPSNQTGIVTPTFGSWLDTSQAASYGSNYAYNPAKAISVLQKAGFKKGSDGIFRSPSGQKLSFTILNNGGFSDWVAAVQTIQASLKAVGIQVTPENLAATTYQTDLYTGKYQLAYGSETGGPTPYFELRQLLYSHNSAPIGTAAGSNWERYSNPAIDTLIDQYGATTSTTEEHSIVESAAEGDAAGRAGDPDHRVGRLVPVRHGQLHRLGHPGQPVCPARCLQLPGLGPADAAPGAEGLARGPDGARSRGRRPVNPGRSPLPAAMAGRRLA